MTACRHCGTPFVIRRRGEPTSVCPACRDWQAKQGRGVTRFVERYRPAPAKPKSQSPADRKAAFDRAVARAAEGGITMVEALREEGVL